METERAGLEHAKSEHEVKTEVSVEVLGDTEHRHRNFRASEDGTLLEVLDEGASKLDVTLLPNAQSPLDHLRGVYENHQIGEPLGLEMTLGEFLRQRPHTHHFAIELVRAIEINTRWRIAPEKEMTPKAILALAGLSWEQYSLYYPADSVDPLPPDTPVKLHRNQRFEAQRDGKYGAENFDAHCVC